MVARQGLLNIEGVVGFVSEEPYEFKFWFKQILEKRIKNFGVFQSFGDILVPASTRCPLAKSASTYGPGLLLRPMSVITYITILGTL